MTMDYGQSFTPWFTSTFTKPDVTAAGSSGAWLTANSYMTCFTVTGSVLLRAYGVVTTSFTSTGGTGTFVLCTPPIVSGTEFRYTGVIVASGSPAAQTGALLGNNTAAPHAAASMTTATWATAKDTTLATLVATNNMTAGGIIWVVEWIPISDGATVVAAAA